MVMYIAPQAARFCYTIISHLEYIKEVQIVSGVWSENALLFERLMEMYQIH